MKIPDNLLEKLKGTPFEKPIEETVKHFKIWFQNSHTVFFPEYTDHGNEHITKVCESMFDLINEASREYITSANYTAIVLSAILHDCAMHLTQEGFLELLNSENGASPYTQAPTPNWKELWLQYLRETKRWDSGQWKDVTGGTRVVKNLPKDWLDWNERHKRLIGEFIRRHHADIAYYIARHGLPGPGNTRIALVGIDEVMADIVGFIARSHNYPLRDSVDLLETSPEKEFLESYEIHIPFIMGLLRVADYLEIKADRAPKVMLQCRSLLSPISRQEWLKHQSVKDLRIHEKDREALYVEAHPENVSVFLGLQSLLESIQKELDATWASWGEVYSRDDKLKNLGILYRRIRSNMDDVKKFGKTVSYTPTDAKFRTSEGELLKLLIGPLYGERPEYGVRELMQNAVDACLERDNYVRTYPEFERELPNVKSDSDVLVTLTEGTDGWRYFTIVDTGIGMTEEVIQKYFLTAGSSYRSSNEWKDMHAQDGNSKVLRSGRFGIGVLAAFLLGDEIEVTTRHISKPANEGIFLSCKLNDSQIEMKWCESQCPIGTTIKIKIEEATFSAFLEHEESLRIQYEVGWDWYTGIYPSILRRIDHHRKDKEIGAENNSFVVLDQRVVLPQANGELSHNWRRLEHPHFVDIHWNWEGPPLVYNSFFITDIAIDRITGREKPILLWNAPSSNFFNYSLKCPSLNIFDKNASLPINIQRNKLIEPVADFLDPGLTEAVCRDILAYLLLNRPKKHDEKSIFLTNFLLGSKTGRETMLKHPALDSGDQTINYDWLLFGDEGITLAEPGMIQWLGIRTVAFILKAKLTSPKIIPAIPDTHKLNIFNLFQTIQESDYNSLHNIENFDGWVEAMLDADAFTDNYASYWRDNNLESYFSSVLPFKPQNRAILTKSERNYDEGMDGVSCIRIKSSFLYFTGSNPDTWLDTNYLESLCQMESEYNVGFCEINTEKSKPIPLSPLAQIWKNIVGQPLIPFDSNGRQSQLTHAYEELAPEIAYWRSGGTYRAAYRLERQQRKNNT